MDTEDRFSSSYAQETQRRRVVLTAVLAAIVVFAAIGAWAYWPAKPLPENARATMVVVYKGMRKLSLYDGNERLRTYRIALGGEPEGHKIQQGDGKTPEGRYVLDYRKDDSAYHRSIHISYPSVQDRITASELGVDPGGLVMIQGVAPAFAWLGRLHAWRDWTDGSIAVTNAEIDEIWRVVPDGTPIVIEP